MQNQDFSTYLKPAFFVDSNHPAIEELAKKITENLANNKLKAIALYLFVRDTFTYNPYYLNLTENGLKASNLLTRNYGYCVEKAALLAALARVVEIPSRLGFAKVTNHLGTSKIEKALGTNVLVFHGYTELFLNEKWVKATPAFNQELCLKFGVEPLAFDGENDSVFQPYDANGKVFMEYLHDYGTFSDIPRELFLSELKLHYPHIFEKMELGEPIGGGLEIIF